MAKGYWIAHVDVSDPEAYKAYVRANAAPFAKFGARFLVRGGESVTPEGAARACYGSPEYQAAKQKREGVSLGDLVIVEGYEGPQPGPRG